MPEYKLCSLSRVHELPVKGITSLRIRPHVVKIKAAILYLRLMCLCRSYCNGKAVLLQNLPEG